MLSDQILRFLQQLELTLPLPKGVQVMNPYRDPVAWDLCSKFYKLYYSDDQPRTLILGINPGRFGGGVTGIPFTDPVKLERECGISNDLKKKTELSADFIYQMIHAFGGPDEFYSQYYISAVSPLGFTDQGKNLNYYDYATLEKKLLPFIIRSLEKQLQLPVERGTCFCLGEDKNFKFLTRINTIHGFFGKIVPLAHPRFIMQYRRKKVAEYISDYLLKLKSGRN